MSTNDPDPTPEVAVDLQAVAIDAHGEQLTPWRQASSGGSREDRELRQVTVSLPPKISDYAPTLPNSIAAQTQDAMTAITRLDAVHAEHLAVLSMLLLRAESVASSKIERIEVTMADFARAAHGNKSNSSATSMVASVKALQSLISSVDDHGPITLDNILTAHRILMADDPHEAQYAGCLRDMQNWIGGSDHSPRNAFYVPPPAETVKAYLDDLLEFANRDDLPVLTQAAVAHAQFESIHPFTDGNGRIGRALINTILRRGGITTRVVVPLASGLVAKRDAYFEVLTAYRQGNAGPIIRAFARAALTSAKEARISALRLADLPEQWLNTYAAAAGRPPRHGSAARKILGHLPDLPFFTTDEMEALTGGSTSSVYDAMTKLAEVGILRPLISNKRKQVWCAAAVVDELEDLGERIALQTVNDPEWVGIHTQTMFALARQVPAAADVQNGPALDANAASLSGKVASVRSTRLPEAVIKSLDNIGAQTHSQKRVQTPRRAQR